MTAAALYLRSSKDRSDVSIDAQRRELLTLANSKQISVVAEYVDAVESGKTEHRPGFQNLLSDMKAPDRPWTALLVSDTSRLSRRRYVAQIFKHEAKKRGVEILYAKVPETDPITAVILEAVFEAMDEVHSLMSREKGLAGMAENVRQGYRAGGVAPSGYRLRRVETGAIRDGEPVHKSILELAPNAQQIARYLKLRATGQPRAKILRDLDLSLKANSAISIEWNALTYAGHTVWNRHDGQGAGRKFRPRADWLIQRDTHPPLISDAEAETILNQLQNSPLAEAVRKAKQGVSKYLLTGLLYTPEGQAWEGWRGQKYRLKPHGEQPGRYVDMSQMDEAITGQVLNDLHTPDLIRDLTQAAQRAAAAAEGDPAADLREEAQSITHQISRAMDMALQLADPGPALRKINELEGRRNSLQAEITRLEREQTQQAMLKTLTEERVAAVLSTLAADLDETPRAQWKNLLHTLIGKIVLDPKTLHCQIHYRVSAHQVQDDTLDLASPRGFEPLLSP